MVSMERISEVLDYPSKETIQKKEKELKIEKGEVAAERLSFSYIPEKEILHEIDVNFEPHSLNAIVGSSGGGKTTLVNLILRFFDATKGAIYIDGQNISEIRIKSLRNRIGMIEQEFALFDGTIMENILYGNPKKSYQDAIEAAQLAAAYDFIVKLPNQFNSRVGPGGSFLSGGQRQRIAIARTLLKNPEIIIFDEATSSLDPESEFHIQEVINRLKQTKTIIVVAHRLSTIKMADKIMVLEDGRFVEEGTFEDLLEKRGAFYRFYWKQFGGLAVFRQHLMLEMERAARYNSHFCLSILKYQPYSKIFRENGVETADRMIDEIDYVIKKNIRLGDNSSVLHRGTIVILAPEILPDQLLAFERRIVSILTSMKIEDKNIAEKDILIVGTRISKHKFRTPEELVRAMENKCMEMEKEYGAFVIDENYLLKSND